ncbi:MAG: LexA repressor [Parcubacteria group bacterium]|nr:LexA repressor [Parcubacteria group bacterium]
MVTKKQQQVLDFIEKYQKKNKYSPTLEEIQKRFKLASVSTAHYYIQQLKNKKLLSKQESQHRAINVLPTNNSINVPILGTISAGAPIEAIEMHDETISLSQGEISPSGKHYALRVSGNSMIDEGIFDGDIVVIKEQQTADDGQTVVAIIDDNQATLKKLYREKGRFRLQPANQDLLPFYRTEVEIRGIVVKIIRDLEPVSRLRLSA